jgi:hypothetical protein
MSFLCGVQKDSDSYGSCDPSVHRPSNLAAHETAGENVDPLKKPNTPNND